MTVDALAAQRSELRQLLQEHAVRHGTFILASGMESRYFFDGKRVTLSPRGARLTGQLVFELLRGQGIEAVGGKTLGADPIATAVAIASDSNDAGEAIPAFLVRGVQKDHGMKDRIAQGWAADGRPLVSAGRRVAIVDDVATTGGSCLDAIEAVEEAGAVVAKVVVLVDRRQGAAETFQARGLAFEALFASDEDGNLSNWTPG